MSQHCCIGLKCFSGGDGGMHQPAGLTSDAVVWLAQCFQSFIFFCHSWFLFVCTERLLSDHHNLQEDVFRFCGNFWSRVSVSFNHHRRLGDVLWFDFNTTSSLCDKLCFSFFVSSLSYPSTSGHQRQLLSFSSSLFIHSVAGNTPFIHFLLNFSALRDSFPAVTGGAESMLGVSQRLAGVGNDAGGAKLGVDLVWDGERGRSCPLWERPVIVEFIRISPLESGCIRWLP